MVFHIRPNRQLGFLPSTGVRAAVPFSKELVDALRGWTAQSKGLLVFGKDGKPLRHMIRILKQTALAAKLDWASVCELKGVLAARQPLYATTGFYIASGVRLQTTTCAMAAMCNHETKH